MTQQIPAKMLLDRTILEEPYPFYRRLRDEAPVWRVPDTRIFIVSDYALLDEATKRVEDFSSKMTGVLYRKRNGLPARLFRRKGILEVLATADPPVHGAHKSAILPNFSPKRVGELQADIEELANSYIERALLQGKIDFMSAIANPLPMQVVSDLVGFKGGDIEKMLQAAFDSTAIVSGSSSLMQLLWCMLRSFVTNRWVHRQLKSAPIDSQNILGSIKRSIENGTLREIEGAAFLHLFLSAGGESTTSLLGSAVRTLADDQVLQQELREHPELIPNFIEEVARLESPFRYHLRSTHKDTRLGDTVIPAGSTVLLFWGAGNRDPKTFDNPDQIDLARPRRHMTFGKGIHMCVGAPLARLETRVILGRLLELTSKIELDAKDPPKWVESLQVRRYEKLPLLLMKRKCVP